MSDSAFDYSQLSPGIRSAVAWIHELGFETCDSGDGSLHASGMDCAIPEPSIVVSCGDPGALVATADRIRAELGSFSAGVHIQATYVPGEPAMVLLTGDSLLDWDKE